MTGANADIKWGGSPFKDLVAGLEFIKRTYADLIDPERMVMLGAVGEYCTVAAQLD